MAAAEVYEEFFVPALFGQFAPKVVDFSGIGEGRRHLDVGCGTGVVARIAADRVGKSGEVVGLDLNPGMLAVADRLSNDLTWMRGSAEEIPFGDGRFDAVTCQFALMFFEDQRRALEEMGRVVKSGGRVVISTWADVSTSPGYAAMVELLDREIGRHAAEALLAPFTIGTEAAVETKLDQVFDRVEVSTHEGSARFASLEAWMHTEIRGWTLSEMIDDAQFDELVAAGRAHLSRFTGADGRIEFPAPALIGVGVR